MMSDHGFIAYSNQRLEWMIPWWVECLRKFSSLPITIVDAGMSKRMRKWCKGAANVVKLNDQVRVASQAKIAPDLRKKWESLYFGDVWESRKAWFLKPQVLTRSPYAKTLYLDIDCQVQANLDSLFDLDTSVALVQEPLENQLHTRQTLGLPDQRITYNSGVILYEKNAPLILEWQEAAKFNTHKFMGDEDLLSALIEEKYPVHNLDAAYNCRPDAPNADKASIVHHVGLKGKRDILSFMIESFSEVV